MSGNLYCPQCNAFASDEECPHWDYEYDPRISRKTIAKRAAEYKEDKERLERSSAPAWFTEDASAPRGTP